jgi:hypothetical protein
MNEVCCFINYCLSVSYEENKQIIKEQDNQTEIVLLFYLS